MPFADAKVEKLIRNAGARRVSAGAIKAMNEILVQKGTGIAKYAVELARHSGRKTITEGDINIAFSK